MREDNYIPLYMRSSADRKPLKAEVIPSRKELFAALNAFVTERHGWLTSIPGAVDVTMECLPGSSLPDELRKLGYEVTEMGDGERILPHQIVRRFVRRPDGELEPLTAESTKPTAETSTHPVPVDSHLV